MCKPQAHTDPRPWEGGGERLVAWGPLSLLPGACP